MGVGKLLTNFGLESRGRCVTMGCKDYKVLSFARFWLGTKTAFC